MTHPYGFDYRIEQEYQDRYQFGFVTLYNGTQQTTISFDGANVFTITPTGTSWHYYRNGTRCEVTGSKTVLLKSPSGPADKGLYFIYIDAEDGTLSASTDAWTLEDTRVPVATIAWDNALTPKYQLSNERHTCAVSRRYHWEHHFADGTEMQLVPTLDGPVVAPSGPADTDNVVGLSASRAADEDIKITLAALTKPNGTDAVYTVFYRASGIWSWVSSAVPYKYGTYIQYDTGGASGSMADLGSSELTNTYLLVTNIDGAARYSIVHGQKKYSTIAAAQAETFGSLEKTGIPIAEYVVVYQFTWATNASYGTKGKCRLAAKPEPINVSASGASFGAAPVWGTITGTIANQADLVAELALKANLAGSNTFTSAQMVDGTADAIQLRVQGHSTQTANLMEWQNSGGTVLGGIKGDGAIFTGTTPSGYATDIAIKRTISAATYVMGLEITGSFTSSAQHVYGIYSRPTVSVTDTKTYTGIGVENIPLNIVSGTAKYFGITILQPLTPTGSGTISENYGLKIGDFNLGATDYAIYTGTGIVRFGDNTLIGTTTDGMTAGGSLAIAQDLAHRGSKAGFYNTTPIAKPAALTTALTSITHTAPGTPDYALQNLASGGYGFATADEGNTVLSVILNLQTRVNELETKIKALGLLA